MVVVVVVGGGEGGRRDAIYIKLNVIILAKEPRFSVSRAPVIQYSKMCAGCIVVVPCGWRTLRHMTEASASTLHLADQAGRVDMDLKHNTAIA